MPEALEEYVPYDKAEGHLTESEAVTRYSDLRKEKPEALIILKDLDCGHWKISIHETDADKHAYLQGYLQRMVNTFWRLALKPR